MKYSSLVILLFCLLPFQGFSAAKPQPKISTFIKVWGFLKYYHPTVAKGKLDWDEHFRLGINSLQGLRSKKEINDFYMNWIQKLGQCREMQDVPRYRTRLRKIQFKHELVKRYGKFQSRADRNAGKYQG